MEKIIICPFCQRSLMVTLVEFRDYTGPMVTPGSPSRARHAYVLLPEFTADHEITALPVFGNDDPDVAVTRCAFKTPEA